MHYETMATILSRTPNRRQILSPDLSVDERSVRSPKKPFDCDCLA
jgi:hypothetical protein